RQDQRDAEDQRDGQPGQNEPSCWLDLLASWRPRYRFRLRLACGGGAHHATQIPLANWTMKRSARWLESATNARWKARKRPETASAMKIGNSSSPYRMLETSSPDERLISRNSVARSANDRRSRTQHSATSPISSSVNARSSGDRSEPCGPQGSYENSSSGCHGGVI